MCAMMRAVRNADLKRRACVRVGRYRRRRRVWWFAIETTTAWEGGGAARCEARAVSYRVRVVLDSCSVDGMVRYVFTRGWINQSLFSVSGPASSFDSDSDVQLKKRMCVCVYGMGVCCTCFALGGVR